VRSQREISFIPAWESKVSRLSRWSVSGTFTVILLTKRPAGCSG
jgi:hypothetical protein